MRPSSTVRASSPPGAAPGSPVVAEQAMGQSVLLKQMSQASLNRGAALIGLTVEAEQEPAMVVEHRPVRGRDGQGETPGAVAEEKVSTTEARSSCGPSARGRWVPQPQSASWADAAQALR